MLSDIPEDFFMGKSEELNSVEIELGVEVKSKVATEYVWNVIVWDDPINLIDYVIWVFKNVFHYSEKKALSLVKCIESHGRAVVWSGNKEVAEMYVHMMHSHQLTATLEKS